MPGDSGIAFERHPAAGTPLSLADLQLLNLLPFKARCMNLASLLRWSRTTLSVLDRQSENRVATWHGRATGREVRLAPGERFLGSSEPQESSLGKKTSRQFNATCPWSVCPFSSFVED
ncbi:MAG: hypothetical protein WKF77_00935 [Planctomycetaceae bacterium]